MSSNKDKQERGGVRQEEGAPKEPGRRKFLRLGALAGAAAALGLRRVASAEGASPGDEEAPKEVKKQIVRLFNEDGRLVEVYAEDIQHVGHAIKDREELRRGVPGKSFVMVIDLAACRNARRCVEECQAAHALRPEQEYVRVAKMGDEEDPFSHQYWMPQLCNHCDNPPCTKVCPVDATFKRDDGIVAIDADRCIGCRFCMAACPYNSRVFNWNQPLGSDASIEYSSETSLPKRMGTVDKCDFCPDMVRMGELPHCVPACPNGVFYFGDRNEDVVTNGNETVRLSQLLQDRGGYRYLESLGTEPRVYYLPARNKKFPFERGLKEYEEALEFMEDYEVERDPGRGKTSGQEGKK